MRRILRKIAEGEADKLGDTSTLADPSIVEVMTRVVHIIKFDSFRDRGEGFLSNNSCLPSISMGCSMVV